MKIESVGIILHGTLREIFSRSIWDYVILSFRIIISVIIGILRRGVYPERSRMAPQNDIYEWETHFKCHPELFDTNWFP